MRLAALALLLGAACQRPAPVVVIAHRGEHLHHPENTVPAIAAAFDLGADYVEVDVRTSADGELVLSHDATVERCTTGHGLVAKMTLADLRALDAGVKLAPEFSGTKIPTFDEALEAAHSRGGLYVHVKAAAAADLVDRIEAQGMVSRVVIYSDIGFELRRLNPDLTILPEATSVEGAQKVIALLQPRILAFSARDFTPDVIAVAKQAGLAMYVDRLGADDGVEGWRTALAAGAAGIQTDHPGELVAFLHAAGRHR
ncbi:MAG TPA: glycerophosphodiester phosphodiesterase family protein [Candidatus Binatia bacterium]